MINSFRARLTVWYLAFFSVLFVGFSLFLYSVLSRTLQARLHDTLASQAATAAGLFQDEIEEMNGDIPKAAAEAVSEMRLKGSSIALFEGGRLVASSTALPPGTSPAILLARPRTRAELYRTSFGGKAYSLLAFESVDSIDASFAAVRRVLFFGLPTVLLIAGIGGYLLAARNLAPLGRMAQQTRTIGDSNLHTRLDPGDAAEELTMLAASFNELLTRLDQSFETMRRFVADASHELRTPLAVIRGEADVALGQDRPSAEYRESLAIILDESRRLTRLVDDLLNLARADAGRVKLQVEEFYISDVLAECCQSMQPRAAAQGIKLECRAAADVPFRGDEQLLRRLVLNLLDNAIRYTPSGGRILASLENGGGSLKIRVSDTGIGIPPEAAPHVFERFYRADKARSREDGGFGLGLSIVKWIAESHRGNVELETSPAGTTFAVTLPQ